MYLYKSESIAELAAALSKGQSMLEAAKFNAKNPFLGNQYASLASIIEVVKPVLKECNLSYSQGVFGGGGKIGVSTILMHASGQWLETSVEMDVGEQKGMSQAQVAGSIITYLRRYSLAAAFGIYAEEDSDASTRQQRQLRQQRQQQAQKPKNGNNAETGEVQAPDLNMTLDEAKKVLTPGGTAMEALTTEQLETLTVSGSSKVTPAMRAAAHLVLSASHQTV